jgi:5-methylcytosine-specific restriction endonuclease McrA
VRRRVAFDDPSPDAIVPLRKPISRAREKFERTAQKKANKRKVYALVDRRDKGKCRACGRRCSPTALGLEYRAERHHIVLRSAGGQDTAENLVTLCAACHADRHAGILGIVGNAEIKNGVRFTSEQEEWRG